MINRYFIKAGYFLERYQQSLGITDGFESDRKRTGNTKSYLDEEAKTVTVYS